MIDQLEATHGRFAVLTGLLGSAVDVESLFERYWESQPLIVRDASWPSELLSSHSIEELIYVRPRGTDVVLARTAFDEIKERAVYSTQHSVDPQEITEAWHDGSTIIVRAIHERDANVAQFVQGLERSFRHPVGANVYFTPAASQGFKTHADDHDVFVLQVEGTKAWTIWGPEATGRRALQSDDTALPLHLTLTPGTAVYIPAGFLHCASTSESASLHLTIGLYPFKLDQLMAAAVREAAQDCPGTTMSLSPVGAATVDPLSVTLCERALAKEYFERARVALTRTFLERSRPFVPNRLAYRPSAIQLDTEVESRFFGLTVIDAVDGHVAIRFPGNFVAGPMVLEPALRFVARTERFRPHELPGGLSDQTKVVLTQRLAREGLIITL